MTHAEGWVPDACTLPATDQPLRIAEFDELFGVASGSTRREPTRLDLILPRRMAALARDLAGRESECCSFFEFSFAVEGDDVRMSIEVPPTQVEVLDALESRVTAGSQATPR